MDLKVVNVNSPVSHYRDMRLPYPCTAHENVASSISLCLTRIGKIE